MRTIWALILCLPFASITKAEKAEGQFFLGLHLAPTTIDGHLNGLIDHQPVTLDLTQDFGLARDTSKLGGIAEYQGPRFGVEFSTEGQTFKGQSRLARQITIDGKDFVAGMDTISNLKLQTYTFNWTIRVFRFAEFGELISPWIGIDLGIRAWDINISASGVEPITQVSASARLKTTLPIPQLGLSAGFQALNDRIILKGHYHYLAYKGATYHHAMVDLRYFPIKNVGMRIFAENEAFNVPTGAFKDDLELALGRKGIGYGVVARF